MKYRETNQNTPEYGKLAIVPPVAGRPFARAAAPWSATTHGAEKKADAGTYKVTDLQQIFPEVANRDTFRPCE